MQVCEKAKELIKSYESLRLQAYPDPASPLGREMLKKPQDRAPGWQGMSGTPWTIGYGSTGPDIKEGTVWTKQQAESRFENDLANFADQVKNLVKVQLTPNQFGALVSLTYNIGAGNLSTSTLLKLLNAGKFAEAADQFPAWNKAGGKVEKGLVKRRAAERALFLSP